MLKSELSLNLSTNLGQKDEKRSKIMSTPSPEPPTKKGRKKAFSNPNKKDKAGRTKLFSATTAGHLDKVKELIQSGADVNFKDNAGWTPLHEAALKGQFTIASYLIECGAQVNVRGFSLDTPLHDACSSNSPECIQLLLDAGADVFALNEDEKRPIDLCSDPACQLAVKNKMKQLDQLIARDKQGRSSLHRACLEHDMDAICSLMAQGADVNAKDNQDATPLHLAAALGHLDTVKALVSNGAIITLLGNDNSETPLHQASRHGHTQVVEYLIAEGADVNMEDKHGNDPYAVSAAYPIIRQLLTARMDEVRLEKEASNALDDIASKTAARHEPERQLTREEKKIQNYMKAFASMDKPLLFEQVPQKKKKRVMRRKKSLSVESDQSSISQKRKGLDPLKKDTSGRTLLHKYAKRGDSQTLASLLELGGHPNDKDYAGWTPLHEAALNGHADVVRLLLKYGADVNSKGADMDTPLHDATENNHSDVVEILLEHGADPFVRNAHNAEPLDIAMEHEYQDIILILQSANPVKKKKTKKLITKEEFEHGLLETTKPPAKKRRLIQAADLEKNNSNTAEEEEEEFPLHLSQSLKRRKFEKIKIEDDEDEMEMKQERCIPTKKSYPHDIPPMLHSPIHTPPPENWNKSCYSPLYTVQHASQQDYYVIDLQVSLFLGMPLDVFWTNYSYLHRKVIPTEGKIRLWSTLKQMTHEDKDAFVKRELYFVSLDDILALIKRDFNHLSANLLTITLDIGYEDEQPPRKKLPPKIAMKMKKCGYSF